jgi:hypothetical protein
MNMWVRRQISVLRECFSNASHWVRQRIPVLRERFHNAPHIDQLLLITILLFTLSLPIYLFVSMPPMGGNFHRDFFSVFGILMIDFLWRERYPALKRWIIDTEHGENNGKDSYSDKELKQDTSKLRWSNTVGFVPLDVNNVVTRSAKKYHHRR